MISAFGVEDSRLSKASPASIASNARHGYRVARVVGPKGATENHVREGLSHFKGANSGYAAGKHRNKILAGTGGAMAGGAGAGAAIGRKRRGN